MPTLEHIARDYGGGADIAIGWVIALSVCVKGQQNGVASHSSETALFIEQAS